MQANPTNGDAVADASQDLAERIDVLESEAEHSFYRADGLDARLIAVEKCLERTIDLVNDVVASQTASTKLYGTIESLLVDISKTPEENR